MTEYEQKLNRVERLLKRAKKHAALEPDLANKIEEAIQLVDNLEWEYRASQDPNYWED